MPIQFIFIDTSVALSERRRLKLFIEKIFKKHRKKLISLVIIFCTDKYLLKINREFLQHDYYTDIITFNLCSHPGNIEGEIYMSIDRVKDNAATHHVFLKEELHRVIFHGVLHLCGFKDKSIREKKLMTAMENKSLKKFFS